MKLARTVADQLSLRLFDPSYLDHKIGQCPAFFQNKPAQSDFPPPKLSRICPKLPKWPERHTHNFPKRRVRTPFGLSLWRLRETSMNTLVRVMFLFIILRNWISEGVWVIQLGTTTGTEESTPRKRSLWPTIILLRINLDHRFYTPSPPDFLCIFSPTQCRQHTINSTVSKHVHASSRTHPSTPTSSISSTLLISAFEWRGLTAFARRNNACVFRKIIYVTLFWNLWCLQNILELRLSSESPNHIYSHLQK